jgi:hypothetical protein
MTMTAVLLLFYLIAPPQSTVICALWISQPPTAPDLAAACPADIMLEMYQVEFHHIQTGMIECVKPAPSIFTPSDCNLPSRLDNYRMVIVSPAAGERVLCAIQSYNNPPTRREIAAACAWDSLMAYDDNSADLRLIGPAPAQTAAPLIELPAPAIGPGLYDQVANPAELATSENLTWLASRLMWTGEADHNTLAGELVIWQNQFDQDIYAAAIAEHVPARLLKRVIRFESQFWPSWGNRPAGEVGMAQITSAAADQYLRWYDRAYPSASTAAQGWRMAEFINSLRCDVCTLADTIAKERQNIYTYARILAAYRYAAGDWAGAVRLWNGEEYLKKVEG